MQASTNHLDMPASLVQLNEEANTAQTDAQNNISNSNEDGMVVIAGQEN